MATGTTLTFKNNKCWIPTEILPLLKDARDDYKADSRGMDDGGLVLTSKFTSYCDLVEMQKLMDESGQTYQKDALFYTRSFNALFEIDF
jgi:hypothetical protein